MTAVSLASNHTSQSTHYVSVVIFGSQLVLWPQWDPQTKRDMQDFMCLSRSISLRVSVCLNGCLVTLKAVSLASTHSSQSTHYVSVVILGSQLVLWPRWEHQTKRDMQALVCLSRQHFLSRQCVPHREHCLHYNDQSHKCSTFSCKVLLPVQF
jgi:hypothetical protein